MMEKEGCEKEDNWQEGRRWKTDDIRAIIDGRKEHAVLAGYCTI